MISFQELKTQIDWVTSKVLQLSLEIPLKKGGRFQKDPCQLVDALSRLEHRSWASIPTPTSISSSPIAADESARIWGDPHFEDAYGGKFDVQGEAGKTYSLLTDTGLQFNGKFEAAGNQANVVGETGLTLWGPLGSSQIRFDKSGKAHLNGNALRPGSIENLAEGGSAHLSEDGKTLTLQTREGYTITQLAKGSEMEIRVTTPHEGVNGDQRMPGGLLGQTFNAQHQAHFSQGSQGEGAIQGQVKDYEVAAGIFGDFWARENERQKMGKQIQESNQQGDKLLALLMAALQSGNLDLAMLIFASLETRQSSEITQMLSQKLLEAQNQRRQLTSELANTQGQKDANTAQGTQIQAKIQDVNDSIQMLTTFIKDLADQKNRTIEFANNFLNNEHQSTMSVVRGMRS